MSRLDAVFASLQAAGRKALVGYLTAGDPDFDRSLAILRAACAAGLDVLELGIPFSDPTADGPVIQAASQRARRTGMTVARALELTAALRAGGTATPLILFSYYNPLLRYGLERLVRDARKAGADGFLVVDLPPEEADPFSAALAGSGLPLIRLVAPTTPPDRIARIAHGAGGFLYAISRTGVTGAGGVDGQAVRRQMESVRRQAGRLPVCLGFGIRSPSDARSLAPFADGLVVGSALVQMIADAPDAADLPERIAGAVRALKAAL